MSVSSTLAAAVGHPQGLKPLTITHASALSAASDQTPASPASRPAPAETSAMIADGVFGLLASPTRLRESFIAAEVFYRPPLSMRNGLLIRRRKA
jgi:hypothetical protein